MRIDPQEKQHGKIGQFYLVEYDRDLDLFGGMGVCGWFDGSTFRYNDLAHGDTVVAVLEEQLRSRAGDFRCELPNIMQQSTELHWKAEGKTSGRADVYCNGEVISRGLLLCGVDKKPERESLRAFNRTAPKRGPWLRADTPSPPRMLSLIARPLAVMIMEMDKNDATKYWCAAIANRCFATAYFRLRFVA